MKFNEKLIELRRKEGLSQEELGYKLNVTRQTVSKWELGQTTPEMDKLVEMSKIFNISVDELINGSEELQDQTPVIEDQPVVEEEPKKNKLAIVIIIALVVVLLLIVSKIIVSLNMFNKVTDDMVNGTTVNEQSIFDKVFGIFDKAENIIEDSIDKVDTNKNNKILEMYNGSNSSLQLKSLLEEVITNNKKEEKKITVKYNDIETQDTEEIQNIKVNIKETNNFEVIFDYDEEGYINKVAIERVVSQFEIQSFNGPLELYAGSWNGMIATNVLDSIITINKTEEQKIIVKYNEIETQDETEIKNIKNEFETFDNCEITYEYDVEGFINKAIIEKK